mgnify:CR=1 FL=1
MFYRRYPPGRTPWRGGGRWHRALTLRVEMLDSAMLACTMATHNRAEHTGAPRKPHVD